MSTTVDSQTKPTEPKYFSYDQLKNQLWNIHKEMREFPPDNEITAMIYEYRMAIVELKMECERKRQNQRIDTLMCRKKIVVKREGDLEIETVKTFFNWEPVDKTYLDLINEKEIKGIEYFTNLINQTRNEQTTIPSR